MKTTIQTETIFHRNREKQKSSKLQDNKNRNKKFARNMLEVFFGSFY